MGQEILYCYKCQNRLLGSEFEKGKAFKLGGQASCAKCVKDLIASMPGLQPEFDRLKNTSSTRLAVPSPDTSARFKPIPMRLPETPKPKNPLILVAIVGAALALGILALMMGGGRTTVRVEPAPPIASPTPPSPTPPVRPEDPRPETSFAAELRDIDERMRSGLAANEFKQVAEVLDAARKKRNTPDWLSEIDLRIPQVEARVRRTALPLRDKAIEAKKRGDAAEIRRLRDQVAGFGYSTVVEDFDRAVADAAGAAEPPPLAGATLPVYLDAMAPGWRSESWDMDVSFLATDEPFEGKHCLSITPKKTSAGAYLVFDRTVDTREYPFVTFAVRAAEENLLLGFTLWGKEHPLSSLVDLANLGGTPKPGEWKTYVVPASAFKLPDPAVSSLVFQTHKVTGRPLVFLDRIAFLKSDPSGTAPLAPPPADRGPSFTVYEDKLGGGCRDHSWSSTVDFAATSPVFEGTHAIAFTPLKPAAGLYLGIDLGLDPALYHSVTFALRLAEDGLGVGVAIYGDGKPAATVNLPELGGAPKGREWKRYTIPISKLNPNCKKITAVVFQVYKAGTHPMIHVDSVAFLKGAPAAPADAYRARWMAAALKAGQRDYAAAQKEIEEGLKDEAAKTEAAADLELLKLAAPVPGEALKAIEKWTKGQKVRVEFLNGSGEREAAEGTVLSADAVRVAILRDNGAIDIPVCEILPSTLAEVFRARSEKKSTDGRAAAAFCLFEGDADAGRKLWGEGAIPEKLLTIPPAKTDEALRRAFWSAEADFLQTRRRAAAVEKFNALLAGDAGRLKPFVAARLEAARDTVFLPEDLSGAGTMVPAAAGKVESCWSSNADNAPSTANKNYVEAEFHAFAGQPYRAWIWAGACCQETYEFFLQGSELPGPKSLFAEPGSETMAPAKLPSVSLKKWHAQHGGPKEPTRWEWIAVALPKYETSGPKKLRVLTAQQGFSVGAIVVSSVRRETPRDAEIKELDKLRFGTRRGPLPGTPGVILHELWTGIHGNDVQDFTKHASFQDKPASTRLLDLFEAPKDMGEEYGARMRGFVHPPATGAYTFWIASDDSSELWVSTDDSPLKKKLVATCTMAAGIRDWTRLPSCKSAPVVLTGGKRYYIEALHKEGGGNDHCAVGWTLPDGTEERPIPGSRLSSWNTATAAAPPAATGTFFRGYNINGQPVVIDGRKWEGKGSPAVGTSNDGFENDKVPLNPPTDEARTAMIRSSAFGRGGTAVKIYQIPPGNYQVYLYVWEDNDAQVYDIFLQNKEAVKGYNSGAAGHWEKLGPWTVSVTDGVLDIHTTGGDANLSGLELWKAPK